MKTGPALPVGVFEFFPRERRFDKPASVEASSPKNPGCRRTLSGVPTRPGPLPVLSTPRGASLHKAGMNGGPVFLKTKYGGGA